MRRPRRAATARTLCGWAVTLPPGTRRARTCCNRPALAAFAYRTLGWAPAVSSDYLPQALVTGFESRGPRVAGFGRIRRPDAVAALAAGPLVVERPACERDGIQQGEVMYDEHLYEAFTAVDGKPLAVWHLASVLEDQQGLFQWRAGTPGDVADAQLATLRLASQIGAALFRVALAEPDTEVEVSIGGRTLRYPAKRGREAGARYWQMAQARTAPRSPHTAKRSTPT